MIQSATCKSEELNEFLQWIMFGNDDQIVENVRYEQKKIIKYNHLVANMTISYNVVNMKKLSMSKPSQGCHRSVEGI